MEAGKIILPALILFFLSVSSVSARSGCCSHHGGVCGCGCCDGSSLSDTCAPYYSQCSQPVYVVPTPTPVPVVYTPTPTVFYSAKLTPKVTLTPTLSPSSIPNKISNSNFQGGLIGTFLLVGLSIWIIIKYIFSNNK